MKRFMYKALNPYGEPVKGVISAENERAAEAQLKKINYMVIACKEFPEKKIRLTGILVKRVKHRDLIQLFLQLEQLIKVGVPLLTALNHARDATESQQLHDVMMEITREVTEGKPVSEAMADFPWIFGRIVITLVAGSEETGNLGEACHEVVRQLKWEDRMHAKVKKATRYPKMLLAVLFIVVSVMMNYVVPNVAGFLLSMEQKLPPVTLALIATSNFFVNYSIHLVAGMIGIYFFFKIGRTVSRNFLYATDSFILQMPVIGEVTRKIAMSRFCQMFGVLFAKGLDMLKCLEVSRSTTENLVLINALQVVHNCVQEGQLLSEALMASGEFPVLIIQMVKIGEESGNLTAVLKEVSEFYDKDVDEAVDAMIGMIEPTLTVILGGIVVWLAAGVFGPVYDSFGKLGS